jgi:hypothetical protein
MNTPKIIQSDMTLWGRLSLVGGLLTTALLTVALIGGIGAVSQAQRTEGIGGLPGQGGGAGDPGLGNLKRTPSLVIEGNFQEVFAAVVSVTGEGTDELIDLGGGIVRWRFNGDLEVKLNESRLATLGVKLGIESSPIAGTNGLIAWEGGETPVFSILAGADMPLAYDRMVDTGLLQSPATLHLFVPGVGRTTMAFESFAGVLEFSLRN